MSYENPIIEHERRAREPKALAVEVACNTQERDRENLRALGASWDGPFADLLLDGDEVPESIEGIYNWLRGALPV